MTAGAGDVSEDLPRQGFMLGPSPVDRVTARLTFACRNKDHETIDRSLKRLVCLSPSDPRLAEPADVSISICGEKGRKVEA